MSQKLYRKSTALLTCEHSTDTLVHSLHCSLFTNTALPSLSGHLDLLVEHSLTTVQALKFQ